ncbi:MAG: IS1634 family transposase [Halobacteria archaeon]
MSVEEVYTYGPELALHRVCEEIGLVGVVDRLGAKGGGPDLGRVVEAMAIARNCDPSSCLQLPDWYRRSSLPFFLQMPPGEFTYWVVLRALDHLQPEHTVPMQAALYENIRRAYGYECERLDIDITSTYFEGEECVLAEYGHSRDHRPDRPQVVVAFVVDQKGVLVTHRVWPGNRSDAKSLKPVDRTLAREFGLDAPRVVDRGMATRANLDYMDRKKERYLVALRADIKSTGLLKEIAAPRGQWTPVGDGEVAASVVRGRRKYVVAWSPGVAEANRGERMGRVEKAEEELRRLQEAVEKGEVASRKQRDGKIGHILRRHRATRYLQVQGHKEGFGFEVERTPLLKEAGEYDGYTVFVTTELDLSEKEVVESYRTRDQVEKAIRTLKSVLGLHPMYVRTREHVIGHIFVCALAYQLRSILRMKLQRSDTGMSVEEAMGLLERLKAVHIVVREGEVVQVHRRLAGLDERTRTLVEVFNMAEGGRLPEVEEGV